MERHGKRSRRQMYAHRDFGSSGRRIKDSKVEWTRREDGDKFLSLHQRQGINTPRAYFSPSVTKSVYICFFVVAFCICFISALAVSLAKKKTINLQGSCEVLRQLEVFHH